MPRALLVPILMTFALTPLPAQQARPAAADLARAVDSLAQEVMRARLTPALGVAVVMDGRTILAKSYGKNDATRDVPADDRTLWYLASTSKAFMGFAVSRLEAENRLAFDAPITRLLPGTRWHPGARAESLTLGHFLSHTHGLDDGGIVLSAAFTGEVPESRWKDLLPHAAPTGSSDLVYTNFGYNVAGMVVDAVHSGGWKDYLESHVFAPAGMTETYHRVTGLDRRRIAMPHRLRGDGSFETAPFQKTDATLNAAGGHLATLRDLARFTIAQMDSGMLDGRRVYPAAAVARSHRMIAEQTRPAARRFAHFDREGWGAGWDIGRYEGERVVSRFGSYATTRSHLSFLPARRIGVVAMTTGPGASLATDLVAAFAYDLEAGRPDARARAAQRLAELVTRRDAAVAQLAESERATAPVAAPRRPLAEYAGRYGHPRLGTIEFAVDDGRLAYRWGALSGPVTVLDAANDVLRFEMAMSGTRAAFAFPASGPARAVSIQQHEFTRMHLDPVETGRRYARWFLEAELDSLIARAPAGLLEALGGREGIQRASAMVADRAGTEVSLVEERLVWRGGKRQYWRTMVMNRMSDPFLLRIVLEADGGFGGYGLGPAANPPPVDSGGPPLARPD